MHNQSGVISRLCALTQCQLCKNSDVKKRVQFARIARMNSKTQDTLSKFWMAFTGKKDAGAFAEDVKWLCRNCAFDFRTSFEESYPDNCVMSWWNKAPGLDEAYNVYKDKKLKALPEIQQLSPSSEHTKQFFKSTRRGSLACSVCTREFSFTNHLIRHVQLAHPNNVTSKILRLAARGKMSTRPTHQLQEPQGSASKIVHCEDCKGSFINKSSLQSHFLAAHIPYSQKVAHSCVKVLNFTKKRNNHVKKKQPAVVYKCEHENCSNVFISQGKLDAHIKLKHTNCPDIQTPAQLPMPLNETLTTVIPQNIEPDELDLNLEQGDLAKPHCSLCLKQLSTFKNVRRHIKDMHPQLGNMSCTHKLCTFFCFSRRELQLHYKNVHQIDGPFFCNQCDFSAQVAGTLRLHLIEHSQLKVRVAVTVEECQDLNAPVSNVSKCPHCGWMKLTQCLASHCQESVCPDCRSVFLCQALNDQHKCPNKVNQNLENFNLKLTFTF